MWNRILLASALVFAGGSSASATDVTDPAWDSSELYDHSHDHDPLPAAACKPNKHGEHPIVVGCPFSADMKFKADGPYQIRRLPPTIERLIIEQVSATMAVCNDPIDKVFGSISRYHGTFWMATRRGVLFFVKPMNAAKLIDYMNPEIKWPEWSSYDDKGFQSCAEMGTPMRKTHH